MTGVVWSSRVWLVPCGASGPTQSSVDAHARWEATATARAAREAAFEVAAAQERDRVLSRHQVLLASAGPVLRAVLQAHIPDYRSLYNVDCYGCDPVPDGDGDEYPAPGPCSTWRLIDEKSREVGI